MRLSATSTERSSIQPHEQLQLRLVQFQLHQVQTEVYAEIPMIAAIAVVPTRIPNINPAILPKVFADCYFVNAPSIDMKTSGITII